MITQDRHADILYDKIDLLFPFYFTVDDALCVVEHGSSLAKVFPDMDGKPLVDFFLFKQPRHVELSVAGILEWAAQVLVLESKTEHVFRYRGQVMSAPGNRLLFVGSPWITEVDDLKKNNLLITDYGLHDTTTDMMQVVKAKDIMMADIKSLVADLNSQKEVLIKAKEAAEHSQRVKEMFLTNMSHEIRTPLNSIIGFSEILSKTPLNAEQQELTQIVLTASENLLSLINDILDFTKIESGNITLEKIPISISNIISNTKQMLSNKAHEKQIELKTFLDDEIPDWVLGDPVRLTQILVNLLGNAIKFTEQGSVRLFASVLSKENDVYRLEFNITDTGVGIPSEKIDLIFDRFVQAENQTTRKFGGSGLGLSITKMLTELFDGQIICKSTLGQGSEFKVILPFTKTTQGEVSAEEEGPTIPEGTRILLAEDNRMNQILVKRTLAGLGASIDIANNGQEAIEMVQEKEYDLILMDLQMPEVDGYSATRHIRHELNRNIPIIACTANVMLKEKERCFALGMNGYLSKPYKAHDLIKIVQEGLDLNDR